MEETLLGQSIAMQAIELACSDDIDLDQRAVREAQVERAVRGLD